MDGTIKEPNPSGLCQCGCGKPTSLAKADYKEYGHIKDKPVRFIVGHSSRGRNNPRWNGGKRIRSDGYAYIWLPGHPRANRNYVMEHILVAEKAFGRPLPDGVEVHHVDEIRNNNKNKNLVICENGAYHKFLHARIRAYRACGHAHWKKCIHCKQWDNPENLSINCQGKAYHLACERINNKERRARKSRFISEMGL